MKKIWLMVLFVVALACPVIAEESTGDFEKGEPLKRMDFFRKGDLASEIAQYDGDMITLMDDHDDYGYGSFNYYLEIKDGYDLSDLEEDDSTTYRGVTESSTLQEVRELYGAGVTIDFNPAEDPIYFNMEGEDKRVVKDFADSLVYYNYKDRYQLIFYIEGDGTVLMTAYTNIIIYKPDKNAIMEVQTLLNENGYDCGTADGIAGNKTQQAIKDYQRDHGLTENGVIDDILMKSFAQNEMSSENEDPFAIQGSAPANDTEKSPYRSDITWDMLMRNQYDYIGTLMTFSGKVLQVFDDNGLKKIRIAVDNNSDTQIVCSYSWLAMPGDLLEGDSVTVYASYNGTEDYTTLLGASATFPDFLCYRMDTPQGSADPWNPSLLEIVTTEEQDAA